jgi:hypothetical protein
MKSELGKDFYCSNSYCSYLDENYQSLSRKVPLHCWGCKNKHRKHPTPEQFKEEYGEEWEGAVYIKCTVPSCTEKCNNYWNVYPNRLVAIFEMCDTGLKEKPIIICACTPFGKPNDSWSPK